MNRRSINKRIVNRRKTNKIKINKKSISEMNLDIIKEVANIASGNSISALADFTEKNLDIYIPEATSISYKDVPYIMGNEENIIVAIHQEILTGFEGGILFTIDQQSFKILLFEFLTKYSINSYESFEKIDILNLNDMELSIIQEIGNILTGSYLNAIATIIDDEINPSAPTIAIDMSSTILYESLITPRIIESEEDLFMIKTELYLDDSRINSQIFLIPRGEGMMNLIKKVKEKYNIHE